MPQNLPEFIDVDLSGMTSQTTLRISDVKLPEGVRAITPGSADRHGYGYY